MKPLINFIILSLLLASTTFAQNEKQDPVKEAIESKHYIFKARTVMPATGGVRQLTSDYDLTVNNDSVVAYLPYFGRAYSATPGQTNNGINFTSTNFTYNVTEGKKGGWIIEIKPKDAGDVQQLSLNLSRNGYGTLHVNNQNRQSISFTGKADPVKKKG
jgi:hypothetical protein